MDRSTATPSMRKTKGRAAVVLLPLTMIFLAGLLAVPWLLNRPAIVQALLQEFEQRTGHTLSAETWHIRVFPSVGMELLQVQVQEPSSATPLFVADRLELALQWLPLLGRPGRRQASDH